VNRPLLHRFGVIPRVLGIAAFSLILSWSLSGGATLAQTSAPTIGAGAEAVTAAMNLPQRAMDRAPYAALPSGGGSASDSSVQYVIEGLGLVDLPLVTVSGSGSTEAGPSASATSWTSSVNLFGGRVRVSGLKVSAGVSGADGQVSASGDVTIEGLVVDNVPVTPVELNHSIPLPGIGTVIAREVQIDPSDAVVAAHGLRVAGDPASGPLKGSQLIVAGAAAGIPGVPLAPPAVAAVPLSLVLQPRPPLDTLQPLTRLTSFDSNDNRSFDDNDNSSFGDDDDFENDNVSTASSGTSGSTRGTSGSTATLTQSSGTQTNTTQTVTTQTTTTQIVTTQVVTSQTTTTQASTTQTTTTQTSRGRGRGDPH
jgi:hypothetical protein